MFNFFLRQYLRWILIIIIVLGVFMPLQAFAINDTDVYVIPIEGDIGSGTLAFVQRAYTDAITDGAEGIIFRIDTYGGEIDSAINLKDLILNCQVPSICYVDTKAISAGSLIALAGEKLAMAPASTIGAAEPRAGEEKADIKVVSMWTAQLRATAEARGKDGAIAAAMSDSSIEIPDLVKEGELLTLSDSEALQYAISDATIATQEELVEAYFPGANVVEVVPTFPERLVKWLSSPYVASILLTIGIAGILIEVFTVGFGVFGAAGLLAFIGFFAGNYWAGYAGLGTILLFVAGLFLIVMEIFIIPGFGVAGVLGILSVFGSIFLASPNAEYALIAIGISLVASVLLVVFMVKNKKTRKVWSKLILSLKQENEQGYVAPDYGLQQYAGKKGVAITMLRPAGAGDFDGQRLDVVTQGEYIDIHSRIEVIKVEGTRVVVQQIRE